MHYQLIENEKQIQKAAKVVENMENHNEVANLRNAESEYILKIRVYKLYLLVEALLGIRSLVKAAAWGQRKGNPRSVQLCHL